MDPRDSELPDHPEDPFPPSNDEMPPTGDDDAEDFVDDELEEDDEATLDEEEAMDDDVDELDNLEDEDADMDIEELRKKYGYGAPAPSDDGPSSTTGDDELAVNAGAELVDNEVLEAATDDYFGIGGREHAETEETEEDDGDYKPKTVAKINTGSEYQAEVPETMEECRADTTVPDHPPGEMLWSPNESLTSDALSRFVHEWRARQYGVEVDEHKIDSRDDEDALYALLMSAYSTVAALEGATPCSKAFRAANQCERTVQGAPKDFSQEERAAFEAGFMNNYKNFHKIKENFVPSRTFGELINYYYRWKKTPRFNELRRTVQRKDYMSEVMDQMEGNKARRREAAEKAEKQIAEKAAADASAVSSSTTTVLQPENQVDYEDPLAGASDEPPGDVWSSVLHHEQPTESA